MISNSSSELSFIAILRLMFNSVFENWLHLWHLVLKVPCSLGFAPYYKYQVSINSKILLQLLPIIEDAVQSTTAQTTASNAVSISL